jgi:hypothetical protein
MAKTQTTCPRCKTPIVVDLQQVFDLNVDPQAKQTLLSGSVNIAHCPACGYSGAIATPVVYHDQNKELLLTYFPPELGMAVNEQEKLLGPLINQVVNGLPNEKKKAYLLQPKTMLTFQTLIETVLQADGITKEMLDEQQKKISLLQRLLAATPESRLQIIEQEKTLIDQAFFSLLSRLLEISMAQGDQSSAKALNDLQKVLMEKTEVGRKIKVQADEVESVLKALQEAGKDGLTREKLLALLLNAKSELQLSTLVGLARTGLDYVFFQDLTAKIESSSGEEQRKYLELRQKLLQLTKEIDEKIDAELKRARQSLEKMIASENIEKAVESSLAEVDDFFAQVLRTALDDARQRNDQDRTAKLEKVVAVIEKASAPPPEVALIEELLAAPDDAALQALLEKNADKFTPQFFQYLNSIAIQGTGKQSEEVNKKLEKVYGAVTKFSMQKNLKK